MAAFFFGFVSCALLGTLGVISVVNSTYLQVWLLKLVPRSSAEPPDFDLIRTLSRFDIADEPKVIEWGRTPTAALDADENLRVIFELSARDAASARSCASPGYQKGLKTIPKAAEKFASIATRSSELCWRVTGSWETGTHSFVLVGDKLIYEFSRI